MCEADQKVTSHPRSLAQYNTRVSVHMLTSIILNYEDGSVDSNKLTNIDNIDSILNKIIIYHMNAFRSR